MDYGQSDSSGTDDDLPPPHMNRMSRGGNRVAVNGKASVGTLLHGRPQTDMESQIHWMEKEAYSAVLRAFIAQADVFSWDKEGLISELRKELRVSDMEHRELLGKVNADDLLRRIREWRRGTSSQHTFMANAVRVPVSTIGPTVSAPRKKQKTAHVMSSLPPIIAPAMHAAPSALASSAPARRGVPLGVGEKKSKLGQLQLAVTPMGKDPQGPIAAGYQPPVRRQIKQRVRSSQRGPPETGNAASCIGRKVRTRWPEDDNFYEAVITNYDPEHVSPREIQWDDGPPVAFGQGEAGQGLKKSGGCGGLVSSSGRGRGFLKGRPTRGYTSSQHGLGKKEPDNIEIFETDKLIKEVERICGADHPNPTDVEKAKVALKEHEQSLIEAIARLDDASDEEDGRMPHSSHTHSNRERVWKNRQVNGSQHVGDDEDDTARGGRCEGSDRDPIVGEGGIALDDQQDDDDDGDEDG